MKKETIFIYGRHALVEALKNAPGSIEKIFLSPNKDPEIVKLAKTAGISIGELSPEMEKDASHQGVIAKVNISKILISPEDFFHKLSINKNTSIVILGGLQDPQNVGGIIRSAAAFGVSGIFIQMKDQAPVTGAVVKVSAGMVFRMPLVSIGDINDAIIKLKERGFKIYALDGEAKSSIADEKFESPSCFIFGNESKGIDKNTMDLCDQTLSIPMDTRCESLNVAASAAITLYSWSVYNNKNERR